MFKGKLHIFLKYFLKKVSSSLLLSMLMSNTLSIFTIDYLDQHLIHQQTALGQQFTTTCGSWQFWLAISIKTLHKSSQMKSYDLPGSTINLASHPSHLLLDLAAFNNFWSCGFYFSSPQLCSLQIIRIIFLWKSQKQRKVSLNFVRRTLAINFQSNKFLYFQYLNLLNSFS